MRCGLPPRQSKDLGGFFVGDGSLWGLSFWRGKISFIKALSHTNKATEVFVRRCIRTLSHSKNVKITQPEKAKDLELCPKGQMLKNT